MASGNSISRLLAAVLVVCCAIPAGDAALGQVTVQKKPEPRLIITQVNMLEGSNFFTLDGGCYLQVPEQQPPNIPCQIVAAEAAEHILVQPKVDFEVVAGTDRFRLVGAFAPRTTYAITFLPGLRGEGQVVSAVSKEAEEGRAAGRATVQAILTEPVSKSVPTPGLKPMLQFLGRARYLPRLQGATLPFEARDVQHVRVSFRQIFPQNLIFWLSKGHDAAASRWMPQDREAASDDVAEEVRHVDLELQSKPDERVTGQIDLEPLDQFGQGVFQISTDLLHDGKVTQRLDRATVVITDIAAIAKQDGDDLFMWTRSAADMRAKRGVHVRAMTYSNREIASCTTGGDDAGCVLTGLMRQQHKPYALTLTRGNDLSYLRFSDVEILDERVHAGKRPYTAEDAALEAYVYSSRGVYRPGETVNLGAVVWTAAHQAAEGVPLQWQILTPRNKVLKEVSLKSSPLGMATLDVKVDAFAPTGQYRAILKSGSKELQSYGSFVETFVPERIGVQVAPKQEAVIGAAMAEFAVEAKYFFGPPVAGGDYTVRCTIQPAWFTVPGHAEFATGAYRQKPAPPIVLAPVMGQLDAEGRAAGTCHYARFLLAFPTVMQVKADVEVTESGSGRVTLKSGTALASATDEIVGLRTLQAANNQIHIEGKLFSPAGDEIRRDTQVTVAVVDEGILQWTDFKIPDPLAYFFEPRRLGVRTFETVGWTFARALQPVKDPGGDMEKRGKKAGVIPVTIVSYWSGIVDSDEAGTAIVQAPMPQFQGKVRVMVVGASQGRSGSAERFVTVRDPLVLQATLPRFLVWNDAFSIPVFVVNMTGGHKT